MAYALPPAPRRYSQDNENQARRVIENAFEDIFARLEKAEADIAAGVTPPPPLVGPTASFTFSATDLAVQFTDTSTAGDAAITAWSWDFGDGATSTQQNPTHTYAVEGDFNVVLTVTDANALSDASAATQVSVTAPPGALFRIPVGLSTIHNHLREGPGDNTSPPIYSLYHYNPFQRGLSNLVSDLNWARTNGVKILLVTADNPNTYGASTATGFNISQYRANLNELEAAGGQTLADAFADGVALAYIGDEPNHSKWDDSSGTNTFGPADVNQCGREHKIRWPGCLTFVRVKPGHLQTGWDQWSPLAVYDAIDYCIGQHSGAQSRTNVTPLQFWNSEKAIADAINVGLAFSQNIWDGGLESDLDGVVACWDTQADGSNIGAIMGSIPGDNFSPGQHISCATLNSTSAPGRRNVVSNPAWLRRTIDVMFEKDTPFILYWTYPELGSLTPWGPQLLNRADYVSAFDYIIQKCSERTTEATLRTPKP